MDVIAVGTPKRRAFPGTGLLRSTHGPQRATLIAGLNLVAGFVPVAVFAPVLARTVRSKTSADGVDFVRQQAPSAQHWFGTSVRGEDVYSRVVYGARTALMVIVLSLAISLVVGVVLGLRPGTCRLARSDPGAGDGCAVRDAVAVAGHRGVGGGVGRPVRARSAASCRRRWAIMAVFVPSISGGATRRWRSAAETVRRRRPGHRGQHEPNLVPPHPVQRDSSLPVIITLNGAEAIFTLAGLGFRASASNRQRPPNGATTSTRRCRMSPTASGDRGVSGAAIVLVVLGHDAGGRERQRGAQPAAAYQEVRGMTELAVAQALPTGSCRSPSPPMRGRSGPSMRSPSTAARRGAGGGRRVGIR